MTLEVGVRSLDVVDLGDYRYVDQIPPQTVISNVGSDPSSVLDGCLSVWASVVCLETHTHGQILKSFHLHDISLRSCMEFQHQMLANLYSS